MAEEECRTIEVKGICKQTSRDTLENYFSSKKRGGEISDIQYDNGEGTAFVTFKRPEGARQALQSSPHIIDKFELIVHSKQAVKVETNKLYIEGFGENTSSDCIKYYVENISGTDVSDVVTGQRCNAIMTVNGELDFNRIHQRSQAKLLEGNVLTIKRVPVCRTIEVTDLPPSATKDSILYKFESFRSGGGDVESVQVNLQERRALVQFKDPTVLTNVLSQNQMLDNVQLKVSPYHVQLGDLKREQPQIPIHDPRVHEPAIVRDQPPPIASTNHCLEIDRDLFQYLKQQHPENLKMALKDRQPTIDERKDTVVVAVESSEAKDEIKVFLNDYKCTLVEFDPVLADRGLQEKMLKDLQVFEGSRAVSFEAYYAKGFMKIVGRAINIHNIAVEAVEKCVSETKEEHKEKTKQREELIETSSVNLKLLHSSEKYRSSERAWAQQDVDMHLVTDSGVSVKGSQNQVNMVRSEIEQLISSFGQRELDQKPSLLLKSPVAVLYVKELLLENNLNIEFSTNEGKKMVLHGLDQATVNEAYQYIISTVRETKIPLSGMNVGFQRQEFQDEVVNTVGSSTPISLHVENDELRLVCFEKDLSAVRDKVANFMEKKEHTEASVPLDKAAVARYLQLHGQSILQGLELSSPGITIKQSTDAIGLSGPRPLVVACEASLHEFIRGLSNETVNFGTPETCAIITRGTAQKIILGIEKERKCAIVVNVSEESEKPWSTPGHRSVDTEETRELMERTRQCRYIYPNGKIIEVHQGDILDHPAEFLVNAANAELKHAGGIAKAIVDRGGYKIQEDCFNLLKDKGKLKLMPGDVVTTDGGKLLCDKVLHVVVPKWSQSADRSGDETVCEGTKEGRYLRHACFDVFNKAKDGRTVVIPALGTGIYKIPHAVSARSLVRAADEFLKEGSTSGLKEVHFVDNEPRAVEAFMKEMVDKYGNDSNFHINDRVRHRWAPPPRIDVPATEEVLPDVGNEFSTKEGMKIQLTVGNIAACETDVIINTVHSNIDLTKNPCSNAILQVAGPELAKHCEEWAKAKGNLKQGDFAVTKGAKLKCKKVFHICCPHWTDKDGEKNLREVVQKLLLEAKALTSVATPALGTGSLKYPEDIVAKVLFEEAINFRRSHIGASTCLKRVEIVVFKGNAAAVKEFTEKFKLYSTKRTPKPTVRRTIRPTSKASAERPSSFATPRRTSEIDGVETRERMSESRASASVDSNDLVVQIVRGDMVHECTGGIGLLVGNTIMASGQLGRALIAKGGEALRQEYAGITKVEPGTVVTTSAGDLNVNYLLHMVPKKTFLDNISSKSIGDSVDKCLEEAELFGLESISLPAVGTGVLKKDGDGSAEILYGSISEYAKRPSRPLKLIRIVILQESVFEKFSNGFMKRQQENPLPCCSVSVNSTGSGKVPAAGNDRSISKGTPSRVRRRISLDIVCDSSTNMVEVKRELTQIERERCQDKDIEDDAITEMSQVYLDKIIDELQNDYCVLIECKRQVGCLRISGLSENVADAVLKFYTKISGYQREKHRVEIISQPVQWLFYDGSEGDEDIVIPERYSPEYSGQIEKAYQDKLPSVVIGDNPKYKIDFGTMIETNLATGAVMEVSRSSREGFPLPECWYCQPIARSTGQEEEVYLAHLDPHDQLKEFDEVYDMFMKTMPKAAVESIERIQNPRLYQIYKGQQKKMNERGDCNEQKLFHGTSKETMPSINSKGFNRSYCGKNATKFGKGVYFARDASYSARKIYAVPDEKGVQYMYVARVLVGRYTKGSENIIVPPPIDKNKPNVSYDTVVNDVSNPVIFVVFYDYQCYPEYLISFKDAK